MAIALKREATGRLAVAKERRGSGAIRFLIAAGTSTYGDWLSTVALVVLLYRLTGSVAGPALYLLVRVAPRMFGPALGGSLADRFPASRVAAVCATAQGACTVLIIPFALSHLVPAIYLAVAAAQFLGSAAQPAYSAVIPRVVRRENLRRINAAYSALFESSVLAAPALGALLMTLTSPELLIAIDSATFAVAALLLLSVHLGPAPVDGAPARRRLFHGFSVVRSDVTLRTFAAAHFASGMIITGLQAVLVIAAVQRFGHDVAVGWLYTAVGAGGVLGSIAAARVKTPRAAARFIVVGTLVEILPLAIFVVASNLALSLVLLFASTFAGSLYQTVGSVALQERVAGNVLGRVNAVVRQALYAGMLAGAVLAALLVQVMGWMPMMGIVSSLSCASLLALSVTRRRARLTGTRRAPEMQTRVSPLIGAQEAAAES